METITGVPGMHVVRRPLPGRVEPVNCYIGIDSGRATIIDTGMAMDAGRIWQTALAQLGLDPATDVAQIVITHFHPDHIGGSGALAALTGAPVMASKITVEQTPGVWAADQVADYDAKMVAHLRGHGMPQNRLDELRVEQRYISKAVVLPEASLQPIEPEARLRFAGRDWLVVPTPGHADGHICLFDVEGGALIAGDHLLERISPAVGRFPDHDNDPLGNYLASLQRTSDLPVSMVYPGHGRAFAGSNERCRELIEHHRERVDACLAALAGGGQTAHAVALQVFGDHHDAANERFALTETLAHLEYARLRGRVTRTSEAGGGSTPTWRYHASAVVRS